MVRNISLTALLVIFVIPVLACAHVKEANLIEVRIVSDSGEEFAKYRTFPRFHHEGKFFYTEAAKGQRYSIQVTNQSDRRIGVVIAVDGRNIVDGKKSDLKRNERMYIIGPYETNMFEGWRTGMDRTNRFYFTRQSDSYAEKVFADASAMGTIALAVYKERLPKITPDRGNSSRMKEKDSAAGAAPSARGESHSADRSEQKKNEQAGTGFGETTYSPANLVHFDPEHTAAEKIVLKYEWRSELCRKGIISCGPKNRFWPEDHEFAPIPKDFKG